MKQKRFSHAVAIAALCLTSLLTVQCTQTDSTHFHIKGKLANVKDSITIGIVDIETNNMMVHDTTIAVSNGAFDVMLPLKHIAFIQIFNAPSSENNDSEGLALFAIPGEECTIEGRFADSCRFSGSTFYRQYDEVEQAMHPFNREIAELGHTYEQLVDKGAVTDEQVTELMNREKTILDRRTKASLAFAKAHPDNEACVSFLLYLDEESAQEIIKMLKPEVKNGRFKKFIQSIASPEREPVKDQTPAKLEGTEAPDFTLRDITGKSFTLSSLRGRYVVLDFWGSWCGWCIKGIPAMKEAYNKYKGKLEMVGIDCQDTEADWKNAVKEHAMPWVHVANGTGETDVARLYHVEAFPTKVIIDPTGKVLKVVTGEDPAFYDELKQVLG